ncbi:FMN-dependent NADH-azoreductase [Sphingomonas immobilis]|uniref:FMN dependent NADH:quinone oxidoreductase n=1 Tax=Sphingomonas immobilis TaxID=3063997 RepID=A0ABT9A0F8_9SPHN|nr:NAD(P)H-dependent oxidoreductase [Sphingomonas sp. CA1-15]MDO7843310.1 NAD(P)H-dependent oxidoreductase [Sphingomonas sp. CA1-15]
MKLLHIDSSITGETSVSRSLTAAIVAKLAAAHSGTEITRRDVTATPLPHLDLAAMPGGGGDAASASTAILEEFLAADVVVIGAPMYNFTIPSQLKAWIDRIIVAGRTFRHNADGSVEGLIPGKRVIVAISRGNFYGVGAPGERLEHLETYLAALFGFIGVTPEFVIAEGVGAGPDHRAAALDHADQTITALAA